MKKIVQPVRGMHDVIPADAHKWEALERTVKQVMSAYGYEQLRTPVLEREELFLRPVGEHTDIVQKELFRYTGNDGAVYCMRPEGTVPVLRALSQADILKRCARVWYMGPMFRHERPQKGRLRQFHQFGAEITGIEDPVADIEMLLLCWRMWNELGMAEKLELQVNNLGRQPERLAFRDSLRAYLLGHADKLDGLDRQRAQDNPLRVLDSKAAGISEVLSGAPRLDDFLEEGSRKHYEQVLRALDQMQIPYVENPRLVRGLDYYNLTVFEWIDISAAQKRQNTIAGGGRYDGLLEMIGGQPCSGTGMAAGMERVLELASGIQEDSAPAADVFLATSNDALELPGLIEVAESLRNEGLEVVMHARTGKIRDLFKHADASRATHAVIIGPQEARDQSATVKPLRHAEQQFSVSLAELPARMSKLLQSS